MACTLQWNIALSLRLTHFNLPFPFYIFPYFPFPFHVLKLRQFINKMNDCWSTWLLFSLHPVLTCIRKLMFLLLLFIDVCQKGSWSKEQNKQNLLNSNFHFSLCPIRWRPRALETQLNWKAWGYSALGKELVINCPMEDIDYCAAET